MLNLDDVSLLPKTRQDGKAVGIVELGGLERSICVLGPWCPYKVRWQRVSTSSSALVPISHTKCLGAAVVVHLRGIKVLYSGIVMFLNPNFILGLSLVIIYYLHAVVPLLHCQFRGIKPRGTHIRLSPTYGQRPHRTINWIF